ncbi:hypothetical protein LN650_00250 [Klebsiella pneumoniae subsp. pneumoniae]|nr:hypothetical protein [Klebsiella pneumoniae subsp. pneumoniae]
MDSIAALDADVITIETSRSDMELLESFEAFEYPNEIGPGVYDIHSPQRAERGVDRSAAEERPRSVSRWSDCGLTRTAA